MRGSQQTMFEYHFDEEHELVHGVEQLPIDMRGKEVNHEYDTASKSENMRKCERLQEKQATKKVDTTVTESEGWRATGGEGEGLVCPAGQILSKPMMPKPWRRQR